MDRFDVIVIGGGQAGLGMGYRLQQAGYEFQILDERAATGDSWRERWDSLELFTPRPFTNLPGLPLPDTVSFYPTKDDMAEYLARYREHFALPVRHNFPVQRLEQDDDGFVVTGPDETLRARMVVIAAGPFHRPSIPEPASKLGPQVAQLHSREYRNPDSVGPGSVLVVGGGNSAAQIAEELSRDRQVTIASNGEIAFAPKTILGISLFRWMNATGMLRADKDAWISKYARPYADTVIGFGLKRLIKDGVVTHMPERVADCTEDKVVFADGSTGAYDTVLWGTGFRPHYDWVHIDGAVDGATPREDRGISPVPGLFWLGLAWQRRLNSALVNGVADDSAYLLDHLRAAMRAT